MAAVHGMAAIFIYPHNLSCNIAQNSAKILTRTFQCGKILLYAHNATSFYKGDFAMLLNGSQILLECLLEQGVDTVFGYPGGAVLNIYDALYDYSDKITHILTSHEQNAGHAADGYARILRQ